MVLCHSSTLQGHHCILYTTCSVGTMYIHMYQPCTGLNPNPQPHPLSCQREKLSCNDTSSTVTELRSSNLNFCLIRNIILPGPLSLFPQTCQILRSRCLIKQQMLSRCQNLCQKVTKLLEYTYILNPWSK